MHFGMWSQLALLTSVSLASAQGPQPERRATPITVRDAAGAVVADAKVSCWAAEDLQEAATDAKGRAMVRLLPWRRYTCFAAREVDGRIEASPVAAVVNGFARELQLGAPRNRERTIVYLLENWDFAVFGPLSVQVSPEAHGDRFFAVDEELRVPPMPPPRRVRVVDGDGATLWVDRFGGQPIDMPAPLPMPLRCRDADGKPVAGAEVWQRFPGAATTERPLEPCAETIWRRIGTTDADGKLVATVTALSSDGRRRALFFEARKAGYANATAGVRLDGSLLQERTIVPVPDDHALSFAMQPDQELRLTPPIAAEVTVIGKAAPGLLDSNEGTVHVTVTKEGIGRLALPRHAFASRCASLRLGDGALMLTRLCPTGLGSEIETTGRRVHVTVRDALGLPGGDAELLAVLSDDARRTYPPVSIPLDATGAAEVVLDDSNWFLFSRRDDRVAYSFFEPERDDEHVALLLQEPPQMTIRFVGKNGELWPEAPTPAGGRSSSRGGNSVEVSFLSMLQYELRSDSTPPFQRVLANPLRIAKMPLPGHTELHRYRIGGREFEIELIADGEQTIVVDG